MEQNKPFKLDHSEADASRAQLKLDKLKSLEHKRAKKLVRVEILNGYALTNKPEKWKQKKYYNMKRNIKEIEKRYTKMASTIEDAKIYDGRGTYDLYQCEKCGSEKITTYADKGVTPFMIECNCGKQMQHTKSFRSVPDYIRVFKWKRPTLEQTIKLSSGMIEHVLSGGLILDSDIYLAELKEKV